MDIQELINQLQDMVLLYGNRIILTITDKQNEYSIKEITGKQCAKYFEPTDNVAEVVEHLDTSRRFCAYCGAKMVEPQESEGAE